MTRARIYLLSDPDLPEDLHPIRQIFLAPKPEPPPGKGYRAFLKAKEKLKRKARDRQMSERQVSLIPESDTTIRRIDYAQRRSRRKT